MIVDRGEDLERTGFAGLLAPPDERAASTASHGRPWTRVGVSRRDRGVAAPEDLDRFLDWLEREREQTCS